MEFEDKIQMDNELLSKALRASFRSIQILFLSFYSQRTAVPDHLEPRAGIIGFTQRWGSALNPILTRSN